MKWEAANVDKTKVILDESGRSNEGRKSSETVEAALARLTKAYSTVISCVGILHKLHANVEKEPEKKGDIEEQCKRVAHAARETLEKAILTDPLISINAPTWLQAAKDLEKSNSERWSFATKQRPAPPVLSSASHKSTVRELAYLSLQNYADLLVAANQSTNQTSSLLLERGVVKSLPLIGWNDENDQRLALVALCDASELDSSDPVLWLKLACAARRLSRWIGHGEALEYRRLERHAIERGMTALPPDVPPNRSILRAMKEHKDLNVVYSEKLMEDEPVDPITMDLPRYSWSILGRMLMRACRERTKQVELKISPMLVLPPRSLGTICSFLQNTDIWKFEASCRALSVSIISARALLERRRAIKPQNEGGSKGKEEEKNKEKPNGEGGQKAHEANQEESKQDEETKTQESKEQHQAREQARSSRSSKRVRSQIITSGKKAERQAKRNSVTFCMLAATLNILSDSKAYKESSTYTEQDWRRLFNQRLSLVSFQPSDARRRGAVQADAVALDSRLSASCMTAFIDRWSKKNSGPFDLLKRYIAHVALNVEDVFGSDQDSIALASFVTDCEYCVHIYSFPSIQSSYVFHSRYRFAGEPTRI